MPNDKGVMKNDERQAVESRRAEALQERPAIAPAVDIYENEQEVLLVADVPGVKSDGLNLAIDGGQLTLEARRTGDERPAIAAEYRPLDYRRTFLLPEGIEAGKIGAELKNGVLRVHLPKAEPLKPRRIEVRTS